MLSIGESSKVVGMRKTGIIFFVLTGVSALFLLKTGTSEQSPDQSSQSTTRLRTPLLQQIPSRLPQNMDTKTPQSIESSPDVALSAKLAPESKSTASFDGSSTEEILAKLVGQWEQTKSTRKQILTIKENGTATMVVEPQGFWKTILGNKVTINIEWSLNEAKLTFRTVGGSPENKLEYINQVWGSEFVREIDSIEDKMFTLRDDEGDVSQKWIRTSY